MKNALIYAILAISILACQMVDAMVQMPWVYSDMEQSKKDQCLFYSISTQSIDKATQALDAGASTSARCIADRPLHVAIKTALKAGHLTFLPDDLAAHNQTSLKIISLLLAKGADPNAVGENKHTPLTLVIAKTTEEATQYDAKNLAYCTYQQQQHACPIAKMSAAEQAAWSDYLSLGGKIVDLLIKYGATVEDTIPRSPTILKAQSAYQWACREKSRPSKSINLMQQLACHVTNSPPLFHALSYVSLCRDKGLPEELTLIIFSYVLGSEKKAVKVLLDMINHDAIFNALKRPNDPFAANNLPPPSLQPAPSPLH